MWWIEIGLIQVTEKRYWGFSKGSVIFLLLLNRFPIRFFLLHGNGDTIRIGKRFSFSRMRDFLWYSKQMVKLYVYMMKTMKTKVQFPNMPWWASYELTSTNLLKGNSLPARRDNIEEFRIYFSLDEKSVLSIIYIFLIEKF